MLTNTRKILMLQASLLGSLLTGCAGSGSSVVMPNSNGATASFTQDAGTESVSKTLGNASDADLIRDQQITQLATQINTDQTALLAEQKNHTALENALTITQEGGIPNANDPTATGTTVSTAGAALGTGVDVFTGNYFGAIVQGISGLKNLSTDSQSINQQKLTQQQVATNSAALQTQITASAAKITTLQQTIDSLQTQINQLIAQDPDKAAAAADVARGQAAAVPAATNGSGTSASASASAATASGSIASASGAGT